MKPHYLRTDRLHPGWTTLMRTAKVNPRQAAIDYETNRIKARKIAQADTGRLAPKSHAGS
jgi:hypothetical protein